MPLYRITNRSSGADLGSYLASSDREALDMMAREAGYLNYTDAQSIAPDAQDEVVVIPLTSLHVRLEVTVDGTIVTAWIANRCMATATHRRVYDDGPMWRIATSDGVFHSTVDDNVSMRLRLRRAARERATALGFIEG